MYLQLLDTVNGIKVEVNRGFRNREATCIENGSWKESGKHPEKKLFATRRPRRTCKYENFLQGL